MSRTRTALTLPRKTLRLWAPRIGLLVLTLGGLLVQGAAGLADSVSAKGEAAAALYPIVDTAQVKWYGSLMEMPRPSVGQAFYGQDADFVGNQPSYTLSRDGLTVFDGVTGLTWQRSPDTNGDGALTASDKLTFDQAQARPAALNAARYGGYADWRLPNAKELQSLVDYTRSPDTTGAAAIPALFACTRIVNEAGQPDYPCYWTGTTHASSNGSAVYVAFGRAMGYMGGAWQNVHGAGAQRSDPKSGDPAAFPYGRGPQGDAIRIANYVRLVRGAGAGPVRDPFTDMSPKKGGIRR
jgi:hypothetical protein